MAAAEVIAEEVEGKELGELHGLDDRRLQAVIDTKLSISGSERKSPYLVRASASGREHCQKACFEAIHGAFSDYRAFQIEEFQGEKPLICTCFGVTEERIEDVIAGIRDPSVERVGQICNAGTGCGSCRMLIQELIDGNFVNS